MQLIKKNEKGSTYQADDFKILYRKARTLSGDNAIAPKETIYFITGEAEITLGDKTRTIKAPEKVIFPEKTYHSIRAITDISFIII